MGILGGSMRCTVYNKKRRTVALAVFLMLLSVIFLCAPYVLRSFGFEKYAQVLRLLSVVAICTFIYIVMRHVALVFVYTIVPRSDAGGLDFTVARLRGNRASVMECVLPLNSLVFAGKFGDGVTKGSIRKKFGGTPVLFYDYSVTMSGADLALVFEDVDRYVAIITEPSPEMREYIETYAKNLFERRGV